MPVDPNAPIEVTAYKAVPDFARGHIKDVRIRWALEEIGMPYATRLIGGIFEEKQQGYAEDQPFGQVPVYKEGGITLFETGSILIHIGEKHEHLLPRDAEGRGRAISWLIAALNSVEPSLQTMIVVDVLGDGQDWHNGAREAALPFAQKQIKAVSQWLGDKEWLEDRFTIGDLVMIHVLREADDLIEPHPNLVAYVERGASRTAFKAAMDAHLKDCAVE